MKNLLPLLFIVLLATNASQETPEDDIDLDLIDINKPRVKAKLLNSLFPEKTSKISREKLLSVLFKFLLNQSIDNIKVVEAKHASGKSVTSDEEDLISNTHLVEEFVKDHESSEGQDEFDFEFATKLMNKEVFSEFTSSYADKLIESLRSEFKEDGDDEPVEHVDL